jgi:ComEC/Rec2-related protein
VAGVFAGVAWDADVGLWSAVAAVCLSAAVVCPQRVRAFALVFAMLAAGVAHGACARRHALSPPLQQWLTASGGRSSLVVVHGRLVDDASLSETGVRLLIDVRAIETDGRVTSRRGRVQATVAGALAAPRVGEWRAGRHIAAPVSLREPDVWRDPGAPPVDWQRLRRSFDLIGTIKSGALVVIERRGVWWREAAATVRARVRAAVVRHVGDAQAAAVVTAILIGDRAGLADDEIERLQAAGTYHTIAISGGNVAIVAAIGLLIGKAFARGPRVASTVALLVLAAYGAIVGAQPSVTRALAAGGAYLTLGLVGLAPSPARVLGLVALGIAVVDPPAVIDVGAWLSFGATWGIVAGAARVARSVRASAAVPRSGARVWRAVRASLAATIAAELALLPIGAAAFGRVSIAGLALNFVAIPAMTVAQVAGAGAAISDGWLGAVASVLGRAARAGARTLLDTATLVDLVPWLSCVCRQCIRCGASRFTSPA